MKASREHRVPLSDRSLVVLQEARRLADSTRLVFPSATGRLPSQSDESRYMTPTPRFLYDDYALTEIKENTSRISPAPFESH